MSLLGITVLTVAVVAVLTAGSIAVRSVSRIWLRHWVERRLAGAPIAELYLDRPQRLIVSAGTGIALAVFLAGTAVARLDGAPSVVAARTIVVALCVLLLGQLVPRAIARRFPVRLVPVLVPVLHAVDAALAPLRALGALFGRAAAGADVPAPAGEATRDSIEDLLREGQLEGVGQTEELAIITGVVSFGEKTAREVMTPREQVFALDLALPPLEMAARIAQAGYSRVPVYEGTIDRVRGIVHAFDVITTAGETPPPVLPAHEARADAPCNELLSAMLRVRRHLAVVRDDAGRTLGILTLEDLLEELVGDIRDEHDEQEEPPTSDAPPAPRGA